MWRRRSARTTRFRKLARAAVLALGAASAACERRGAPAGDDGDVRNAPAPSASTVPPAAPAADASVGSLAPTAEAAAPPVDAGMRGPDADSEPYLTSAPRRGKSIGHTSVVLKLELASGEKAVFKPDTRRGPGRYRGEIAAYRLGVALGLDNVPPAYARTFERAALEAALGGPTSPAGKLLADEALGATRIRGALVPWIDDLTMLPLESEPLRSRVFRWLGGSASAAADDAPLPGLLAGADASAREDIARQASTLVVFDHLTGNWDRWSGANVGYDRARRRVLFIDNDGAFFAKPPEDGLARNARNLEAVRRFSRSFVARLRALDDDALAKALGEERPGMPLLAADVIAAVAGRRRAVLATVDALVERQGDAVTLAYP